MDMDRLTPGQRWQQRKRQEGCCIDCGKPRENLQRVRCEKCRVRNLESSKAWQARKKKAAKKEGA